MNEKTASEKFDAYAKSHKLATKLADRLIDHVDALDVAGAILAAGIDVLKRVIGHDGATRYMKELVAGLEEDGDRPRLN